MEPTCVIKSKWYMSLADLWTRQRSAFINRLIHNFSKLSAFDLVVVLRGYEIYPQIQEVMSLPPKPPLDTTTIKV